MKKQDQLNIAAAYRLVVEGAEEYSQVQDGERIDSSEMGKLRSSHLVKAGNFRSVLKSLGYKQDPQDPGKFMRGGQIVTIDQDLAGSVLVNDEPFKGTIQDFELQFK